MEWTEQNDGVINETRIEKLLREKSGNPNIVQDIEKTTRAWNFTSDLDLEVIKTDVEGVIDAVKENYFDGSEDLAIYKGVHWVVNNCIWENVMPLIRALCCQSDSEQYEKCKLFSKMGGRPGNVTHDFSSIPFTAAIVELSMLDTFRSPVEKLNCLCATYDFLFAEAKSALVTLISEYSDKEIDIPTINNNQISPILLDVIIKSKLLHPCSNLFYMKLFGQAIIARDQHARSILTLFENTINEIDELSTKFPESQCHDMEMSDIDMCQIMEMSARTESRENVTLTDQRRRRLVSLVMSSTSHNDYVPEIPRKHS